jgi:hypothetical protein
VSSKAVIWEDERVPSFSAKEDVVILAAVERRIKIDEVYGLVADIAAQHVEIIAVKQLVVGHCPRFQQARARLGVALSRRVL